MAILPIPITGLWALFACGGGIVEMMIGELRWVAPEDAIEDEGLSMDQASTQQTHRPNVNGITVGKMTVTLQFPY